MRFDPKAFESLSGLEASDYSLRLAKKGIAEADVLPYFREKAAAMDLPHLEVAVFLLAKVGTSEAWITVADYLDHPDFNIRFVATKMMKEVVAVDEHVMKRAVAVLSRLAGDGLADELKVLLRRPANTEAGRIAAEYISNTGGN